MKFLRLLLFVLSTGILFTACQKEFSAETGSSQGTLVKDAAGDCPANVSGAYKKDTALTAANYVDVQVDFAQVGIYIINTDTVNGYYFRAAGAAAVTGLNTVRLIGTGKPIAVGTDNFTVHYGTSTCEFATNVTLGTGGGGTTTAVFTFPNGTACSGATQTNNFFVGLPTNASTHTITLLVNVTTAGTYNLNTTAANGLTFSGTGLLAAGNNQPIVLGASGTPAGPTAGTINYTFSTTTPVASSCGFGLNVQAAPTPSTFSINCATAATQTGTFQAGTALTAASKITLSVTPTTTGSYSITTTTVNGVSYIGAGIFTTATTQNVDLFANPLNNTPTAAGSFNYATVGGTTICSNVSVTYTAPPASAATDSVSATVNGTFVDFDLLPSIQMNNNQLFPGYNVILITGDNSLNFLEAIQVGIGNATGNIPPATYNVNQGPATLVGGQYTDGAGVDFTALTGFANPTPAFTVTILSITGGTLGAAGTRVKGNFAGAVKETAPGTATKAITNGYFDLTFQ
jgi:hypothetical protein